MRLPHWRVCYSLGMAHSVAFVAAPTPDEAATLVVRVNPGAVVTLVIPDVRDPGVASLR